MQTAPYLMMKEYDQDGKPLTGNDRYEGFCADVAEQIARIVDFEYKVVPVKDGKYGGINADGTWNGMVGELIRGVSRMCTRNVASSGLLRLC